LEVTRTLLSENSKDIRTKYDALVDYGLDDFYWRGVASIYGWRLNAGSARSVAIANLGGLLHRRELAGA
jgi:hypothetical protein